MTTYLIRIINLDSYMSPPVQGLDVVYSDFRGALINQVPIIRLFGSTPTGQKICVHIHGVFPYFYIPYDGTQEVNSLMHHIAISIDKAVNISLNQASSKTQHVYKISLVSGIPMYGYHNKKHQFLKVYLYNPLLIRKVGNLLMNETTLGKIYQPHEIHLSFPLQFMIDYNLHGMSNMILSDMKFRKDPTCVNPEISPERYLPLTISKVTVCELEGDAFADDIVNRQEIASGNIGVNPGIFALWADEKQRRRNKGETSQIEHLLELKRTDVEPTKSHLLYKQALLERLAILSTDVERPTEEKLNLSVYPAETPDNVSIQNASLIDIHTPSSVELSLDDTLISSSSNPNDTVLATQNMSMDAEARNLLEILRELGENVRDDEEDDSLLTQIVKEDEEEDKFLDLSMPLEAVTTPKKIITQEEAASESEDELDKTLIPQLDGEWDSGDEGSSSNPGLGQRNEDNRKNVKQRLVKKVLYVKLINGDIKREKNMPLLDFEPSWESYAFSNQNTNTSEDCINPCNEDKSHLSSLIVTDKFNKSLDDVNNILIKNVVEDTILNKKKRLPRPADVILQERIRILGYHIKRLKRQNQLIRIIRKTHRKEHNICVLVSKKGKPKFNVISKIDMLARYATKDMTEPLSKIPIISDILLNTANHIDPDLYMTIQFPDNKHFLFTYNESIYPDVIQISKNLTEVGNKMRLKELANERRKTTSRNEKSDASMHITSNELSNDNFQTKVESSVCYDDLPNFLKIIITNISSSPVKIEDKIFENNNYLRDAYVDKNTFKSETEAYSSCQSCEENKQICVESRDIESIIDADNTGNIYIFSSKYLTDVKDDNLMKNQLRSPMKLRQAAENVKQQLQKHIEYLQRPQNFKTSSLLTTEEHDEILDEKFVDENIRAPQKNYIFDLKDNNHLLNNNNYCKNHTLPINKKCDIKLSYVKHTDEYITKENKKLSADSSYLKSKKFLQNQERTNSKSAQQNGCKEWNNENTDNKQSRASSSICSPKETFAPYKNLRRSSRISSSKYQEINSKMFIDLCLSESDTDSECSFSTESSNSSFVPSINKRKNWAKKLVTNLCKLPIQNSLKQDVKNTSKMCLSFDGSKDSSSSEDDGSELKKIEHLKKQGVDSASRYSALPVSIVSSPISYGPAGKHLVSQNANTTSEKKKAPLNRSQQTFCDNSVKRRLSFSNNPRLQTTMIEEKVVCSLSPKDRKEHIIEEEKLLQNSQHINAFDSQNSNSKNNFQKDNLEKFEEGIFIEKSDNINKDEDQTTNSLSDSEDEISESFFRSSQSTNKHLCLPLTAAEKYDKETNYIAKEGSSKEFTNTDLHVSIYNKKNSNESSGSSSLDLLTPYQRVANAENINLSAFKENEENEYINKISDDLFSSGTSENQISLEETSKKLPENSYTASKFVITIPLKKAPSKGDVFKSLDLNKIPYVKEEMPFYSNVADVTGSVEVGYNVLKINSRTTMHFPEFESQTDSINTFRKFKLESLSSNLRWKKSNLKHTILKFCDDRSCIITPAKKPPSVELVKTWLREKSKTATTTVKKAAKIKVFLPTSPGHDGDDDDNTMDISLTLSPCTPSNSQSDASQKVIQNSLDSSQVPLSSSPDSPVLARRGKSYKKRQKKSLLPQSLTPSLRKSLLLSQDKSQLNQSCQITGVTANNTYGFDKSIENLQQARAVVEHQNLTLLVMELHIRTRVDFKPNPELDPICAIFYSVLNDVADNHPKASNSKGVVVINSLPLRSEINSTLLLDGAAIDCKIDYVSTEENLFTEFLKIINYWDPDIISGYEIEMLSWGYLIERANILGINLKPLVARTKDSSLRWKDEERQEDLKITGRIVLDVWRLMRHEIALQSYTFESIVYHILHKRVPHYSFRDLSFWWDHRSNVYRHRTAHYYLFRVVTILELFDKLDLIGRTSELARLFGIQFFEVLSRGSQFRVESMMLRLAKPLNYIPVSPSVQQRAKMKAPEYIALVLEPESKLYNDPVIVLDFQSLYPSIIIAYNYCFTTCVGRVECLGKNTPFEFGASQLRISKKRLEKLLKEDLLNFSPCGVGFVKKMVRDGILPRMLREILDTRLMVKNAMKENTDDQILQKVLHNRQLGLKLIANVTYGYTAANFSGRMPSVEVGDSVVSKGRETLQRAIEMVETTAEWGARVVYGDTDSLFVLVPGRSRERAFEVGKKIADAVTKANPDPIKLKMEKIYQPCILQTKKRYVGYMYESPDQKEPVYDAKGIETVRRDGCPAVSKMLEKCLRILFETKDVSLVKKYVLRQFNKIIAGRASIQDLTFAKEYRGAAGYRPGACVPALELARKWKAIDKRSEPRSGERVPYIIVSGPPGLPLIRLVRSPMDLLNDSSLRPNALYYITRVIIPPINRCFNLIGADLNTWFNQMPRKQIQYLPNSVSPAKKSTISQYFSTTSCIACAEQTQMGICDKCNENPQVTTITLMEKLREWEEKCYTCNLICQSCSSSQTEVKCVSLDCPILYRRVQTNRDLLQAAYVRQLLCSSDFLF